MNGENTFHAVLGQTKQRTTIGSGSRAMMQRNSYLPYEVDSDSSMTRASSGFSVGNYVDIVHVTLSW